MSPLVSRITKPFILIGAIFASLGASFSAEAALVGVDPTKTWIGFMNVYNLPADGGAYQFGSGWGTADLIATFSGNTLTLAPNTNIDRDVPLDPYWWKPDGTSNKVMDANFLVLDDSLAGQSVNFVGTTLSNTLVKPYVSYAFIRDFVGDYSSYTQSIVTLSGGAFDITLATTAGDHIQYGFETNGPNARINEAAALGSVSILTVPEPVSIALFGIGLVGIGLSRRKAQK